MIDPQSLELLATYDMPNAPDPPGTKAYQNFAGGGYFFLDGRDRVWSADQDEPPVRASGLARTAGRITKTNDYDLTSVLEPDERISSALPDFRGRIWFVSKKNGKVGDPQHEDAPDPRHPPRRGHPELVHGRPSRHLRRLEQAHVPLPRAKGQAAGRSGRPRYGNSGVVKPGQADAGSGTTPTIMRGGYVAITDNADPMNVVVYRKAVKLKRGQRRVVCRVPVFDPGASATENSLITERPLAVRGEQLRLPGPVRPELRCADHRPASRAST